MYILIWCSSQDKMATSTKGQGVHLQLSMSIPVEYVIICLSILLLEMYSVLYPVLGILGEHIRTIQTCMC